MNNKSRKKIPVKTETELLFKSDYECCVCRKRGDHIHHLDGNRNNNQLDNLSFLCFDHHNLASVEKSLSKKLTKVAIIKYRSHHYEVINNKRKRELNALDNPITNLTDEKLLTVTKTALIILELENIKARYFSSDWEKRETILGELDKYVNHTNNRLAHDILYFLTQAAGQTRGGMSESVASGILGQILNFCPSLYHKNKRKQGIELARQCIEIGDNIAYDSFIHLGKINIAMYGLTIIKFIYRQAKQYNIPVLKKEILNTYDELSSTLKRPERNDLHDAGETLKLFRADLEEQSLAFPVLTEHLMARLGKEQK